MGDHSLLEVAIGGTNINTTSTTSNSKYNNNNVLMNINVGWIVVTAFMMLVIVATIIGRSGTIGGSIGSALSDKAAAAMEGTIAKLSNTEEGTKSCGGHLAICGGYYFDNRPDCCGGFYCQNMFFEQWDQCLEK